MPDLAHLVGPRDIQSFDVMGPTVEFLTTPYDGDTSPCVMRGTIPPGVFVPLHSHADPETFIQISGEVDGLVESNEGFKWVRINPGDIFHVPGGAKHAFRNQSRRPAIQFLISTSKIGRFFQEVGTPSTAGARPSAPPSAETLSHLREASLRYGYWNGTPEENARIGLSMPAAA